MTTTHSRADALTDDERIVLKTLANWRGLGNRERSALMKILAAPPVEQPEFTDECADCGCLHPGEYWVHPRVWSGSGMAVDGGKLCLVCLEARLQRRLTVADFPADAAINRCVLWDFSEQPAAAPIDEVTCARMGHGVVAIGDCFSPELQEPGIIFMELPEQRDIGLDTGDVFPEGSRAPSDKMLAYISFANPNAIDQTISVLQRIKAKHFPVPSPADERAAFVERVMGMFEAWPKGKPGPTDEPESHYRFGYNTALEDVLTALDVGSPTRRAASANETGADGAKTEAEIRKTMTPEQIRLERNLTCEAIDGAMSFGYQNTNPPPSADHWLAPFWKIGRKQYAAEFALHYLDDQLTEYLKGMPADETSRNLRDIARNALVDIEAAPRSPAMAAEALAEEHSTIECQAHSGPDCTECGGTGVWSGKADERAASWHCEDPVQKCRAQCDSCAKQARAATEIADERAVSFEAWCDRFPEISAVERLRDAWQEARAALPEDRIDWIANTHCPGGTAYPVNVKNAIREALREARISDNDTGAEAVAIPQSVINALRFYANGHHFNIDENHQQFDTVSGEPQNWLCSERDDDCTMIEDGSIAKAALCGGVLGFEESEKPIEGEVFTAAQQPAQADARVGLTAAARATIMDACQSISRNADGVKAGCAIGDEWPDAEDKAFYDAELQLLARLVALLNDSGQSEPETATVARIEQLRKALFESRDAMRVMSNWAKKPDPAGHSWAVRMVDRANAALNGEPEPRAEVTGGDELKARRLIRYGECRCILTQYCDGMCNPIYEDDARTGASS
ncbi:hypothetical protein [Burkholderia pseudomallei]|uniref:hypothetical protein n=1 Tax=Burkholderia pseudomallei TaxID=28450 RepID=UPI0018F83F33|nr:hypothetical protein [Burkholderia pseudomallei]CAJ2960188.1 gp43 [Burkholderia pseudomallei]CAJ9940225.1 gp43 [Burkholderia pseudomallei]